MLEHISKRWRRTIRNVALCALAISSLVNILAFRRIKKTISIDDSQYSYVGDDFPTELPLRLDTVEMAFEDVAPNNSYRQADLFSWLEWHAIDHFPRAHGFVSLGPDGRKFGVSMFHQLHCLEMIREAFIVGPDGHASHCLNFLRQTLLCAADTTLERKGVQTTHSCRDWMRVYDYITDNQLNGKWPAKKDNATHAHA